MPTSITLPLPDSPDPDPSLNCETKTFALALELATTDPLLVEVWTEKGTVDLLEYSPAHALQASTTPSVRYRVLSEIGRGGVGVVLRAWDFLLGREVALKVLQDSHRERPEVARRFLGEARITGRLQHHGIVTVHDMGTIPDGRPYFAMTLVRGKTLDNLLRHRKSPTEDLPRFVSIFHQVVQAVAYAHAHGVIHRDLKPGNIMVGEFGLVMVMDWGLAKRLMAEVDPIPVPIPDHTPPDAPDATQYGAVFGTPAYLPPEQAAGILPQVDRRADVFGLGSILCEILTGQPPYSGPDSQFVLKRAIAADLTEAFERLNGCPVPLDLISLARWCLTPDLDHRPASAAHVAEVLADYLQADQRRAELDLVRFFELTLDLFCIAGTDGFFRRVNDNFCRTLGYTADELTTRQYVDFVHPDDRDRTIAVANQMANGRECVRFVNRYRHAEGQYLWLEWNARAVLEEQAIYAVARDIGERPEGAANRPPVG